MWIRGLSGLFSAVMLLMLHDTRRTRLDAFPNRGYAVMVMIAHTAVRMIQRQQGAGANENKRSSTSDARIR
jgi:hypothetical protein